MDEDGEVIDVYLQARHNRAAAMRFFKRLLRSNDDEPRTIVTDKLCRYGVAHQDFGVVGRSLTVIGECTDKQACQCRDMVNSSLPVDLNVNRYQYRSYPRLATFRLH